MKVGTSRKRLTERISRGWCNSGNGVLVLDSCENKWAYHAKVLLLGSLSTTTECSALFDWLRVNQIPFNLFGRTSRYALAWPHGPRSVGTVIAGTIESSAEQCCRISSARLDQKDSLSAAAGNLNACPNPENVENLTSCQRLANVLPRLMHIKSIPHRGCAIGTLEHCQELTYFGHP